MTYALGEKCVKIRQTYIIRTPIKVGFEPGTKPVPRPDEQLQYDTQTTTTTTQVYNILSLYTIAVRYTIKQENRYVIYLGLI